MKAGTLGWYIRFVFMPRTDRWYQSLFASAAGRIAGEVTAAYARLPTREIARIHAIMPEAKMIYILRNPIERTWSEAAM